MVFTDILSSGCMEIFNQPTLYNGSTLCLSSADLGRLFGYNVVSTNLLSYKPKYIRRYYFLKENECHSSLQKYRTPEHDTISASKEQLFSQSVSKIVHFIMNSRIDSQITFLLLDSIKDQKFDCLICRLIVG